MILRPSQSKSHGWECPKGSRALMENVLAMVQGHTGVKSLRDQVLPLHCLLAVCSAVMPPPSGIVFQRKQVN